MARTPKKALLYHHTPMVTDKFDATDAVMSLMPTPGIDFHSSPKLFSKIRDQGVAPDYFFKDGIAAPATPENESGLRHYAAEFTGDRNRVINSDVPLGSQTTEVRDALKRMGIRTDEAWSGGSLSVPALLWQRGLEGKMDYMDAEQAARSIAGDRGDMDSSAEGMKLADLRHQVAPDILQALIDNKIPAITRQGSGVQAGAYYLPKPPRGAVREYKVTDPSSVNIIRTLAAPGAVMAGLGAAQTAKADSTAVAQPGETLAEFFERVRPTGVNSGTPSVASQVAGAVNPYVPDSVRQIMDTESPLSSYAGDFEGSPEFSDRLTQTMSRKVIADGAGGMMSPAEFAAVSMGMKPGPITTQYAARVLMPYFSGQKDMEGPQAETARMVLKKLKSQSMAGEDRQFTGQTLKERESRRISPMSDGRYITSEGMDQNLAAQQSLNLLSTMSRDPEFQPNYTNLVSGGLGAIGAMGGALLSGGETGGEAGELAYLRNVVSRTNPRQARAQEALYWDKQAEEGQASRQYKSSFGGGSNPQTSFTTGEGMARQFNDSANYLSYAQEILLPQILSGTPMYTPASRHPGLLGTKDFDPGKLLRTATADLHREVPIVPERGDPVEARANAQKAESDLRKYLDPQLRRFINEYPLYQRSYNNLIDSMPGTLGDGLEPFKVDEYSFPSPALNLVATAPKYYLDAPTVATLGAAAPFAMARGTAGAMAKMAAKDMFTDMAFQEYPLGAGLHFAEQPYASDPMQFFKPIKVGDVLDDKGMPANPNDPRYPEFFDAFTKGQQKLLGGLLDYGVQNYR